MLLREDFSITTNCKHEHECTFTCTIFELVSVAIRTPAGWLAEACVFIPQVITWYTVLFFLANPACGLKIVAGPTLQLLLIIL